ncbi:MAG: hypothetical protein HN983_00220 [Euryarchaeota archaeon]|nr:hypothetical protein [Euryarchaeota archaeon]MBT4050469.1 hypothetical protein [Euryarchaeota archaeon]MBT4346516.1 hypothetical protein [Euryarchaeota archaeon]MBT4649771.1 hypothetical protein [Euryarchaeota archaeon]MBT4962032.1 hypothetical protein [Euryarchaeota archaeon]
MDGYHPVPWFPAWPIEFSNEIQNPLEIVTLFDEWRPNNRWLLMTFEAAASEVHLWTTWFAVRRLEEKNKMIARKIDAEFLRLIAGTRQIKIAFDRAGLRIGDTAAWILYLPEFEISTTFGQTKIDREVYNNNQIDAERLSEHLNARIIAQRPFPNVEGLVRIGAITEGEKIALNKCEDAYLLHSAMSEL